MVSRKSSEQRHTLSLAILWAKPPRLLQINPYLEDHGTLLVSKVISLSTLIGVVTGYKYGYLIYNSSY